MRGVRVNQATKRILLEYGYTNLMEVPGRGLCGINRFLYTTGLMVGLDQTGYSGRYCYRTEEEAVKALVRWDGVGDPPGDWVKYKGEGGERDGPGSPSYVE